MLLARPNRPPQSVLSLFSAGEPGFVWLPYFTKSLFQDAAMTIPAQVGGAVVKMLDLSGRGNTVTLTNASLQRDSAGCLYLAFNGLSTSGVTSAIDFSGVDKIMVIAGVHKASDAAAGTALELSVNATTNAGAFALLAPATAAANYRWRVGATTYTDVTATSPAAPVSNVVTGLGNLSGDSSILRIDGQQQSQDLVTDLGAGNLGNYAVYLGSRAGTSSWLNGRFYGAIVRGSSAASTAGQIADAERYLARLTGVSF